MRYSSIVYSCYAASVVISSTDFGIDTDLLQARNEINHPLLFIYPRSPVDRPSKGGNGQSRGSTPAPGGTQSRAESSPQPDSSKERTKVNHNTKSPPQSRTPQLEDRPPRSPSISRSGSTPQPQDTSQLQGTAQSRGTPRYQRSEMTPTSSNRAHAQNIPAGGRGRGYGRGQSHGYNPNRVDFNRDQNQPPFYIGAYQPYPANQYGLQGHRGYPVHSPVTGYRGQPAASNSPARNGPSQPIPDTRVETFSNGPAIFHTYGGERRGDNTYLASDERASKGAQHDRVSYAGGEALRGGRVVTQVTGQKVQSNVEPGPGGSAQIRYQTPSGLAASTFTHPAKGQLSLSSANGTPVTLQTIAMGPSETYATARNSPPRNSQ